MHLFKIVHISSRLKWALTSSLNYNAQTIYIITTKLCNLITKINSYFKYGFTKMVSGK